jgi:hypothetical protein
LVLLLLPFAYLLSRPVVRTNHVLFDGRYWPVVLSVALIDLQAATWKWFDDIPLLSSWATLALVILFVALARQTQAESRQESHLPAVASAQTNPN